MPCVTGKSERRTLRILRLRWSSGSAINPTRDHIEAAVRSLRPEDHAVYEDLRGDHQDEYAQVRLRDDDIYQLEYRDGAPSRHFQTMTNSADEVIAALDGFRLDQQQWRDTFQWTNIGHWFG